MGNQAQPTLSMVEGSPLPLKLQSLVLYRNHLVVSYQVSIKISSWGLDYVVITSVDRDGLADQGSGHFAEKVEKLKTLKPKMLIEALVPDFRGDAGCVEKVTKSGLDVFAHNIETVEELQRDVRDDRANFKQSLDVLMMAKEYAPAGTLTKTSIMLGCGETPNQVVKTMEKVRAAGVDVMTFGLYLRPSKRHMPVLEYITPEAFEKYRALGMEMGFDKQTWLNSTSLSFSWFMNYGFNKNGGSMGSWRA
ncbi:lipoyl synthase, mitochondrial-like [Hibiscus syriacus]|uniref:lipoyl synthase, mitochondrial-like n=1 Tax=Hibiscus syriacus TaxID=106335 RepID=UPI001924D2C6|nr:lipoyl synthase, mitochondrial-like [Hibiscus syriacus]